MNTRTHLIVFLGAKLNKGRMDFLVNCATHGDRCVSQKPARSDQTNKKKDEKTFLAGQARRRNLERAR